MGEETRFAVEQVAGRAQTLIMNEKNRAAEGIGKLAQAVRAMAQKLDEQGQKKFSDLAMKTAEKVEDFGRSVREKELKQLLADTKRFGKEHPLIFWGSAFAAGFLLARLLMPTPRKSDDRRDDLDLLAEDEEFWRQGI